MAIGWRRVVHLRLTPRTPGGASITLVREPSAQDPDLTVVMPVRNVATYLPDMLSALVRNAVTLPRLQIVIVDDASVDATSEVIAEFADRLPGLEVVRNEQAVGAAEARNIGLDRARSSYVTFLDGDDWIAPDYLRALTDAIAGLDCDFVRVDHVQVRGGDRVLHRAPEARRGVVLPARAGILPANRRTMVDYPYSWAGVYRRDLGDVLRFRAGLHTATDRDWIWRLHRKASDFAVVSLAGVFYRRLVPDSLTQVNDARQLHFLDAYADVLRQVAADREFETKAMRQFLAILGRHLLDADTRFEAALQTQLVSRAQALLRPYSTAQLLAAVPERVPFDVLARVLPDDAVLAYQRVA